MGSHFILVSNKDHIPVKWVNKANVFLSFMYAYLNTFFSTVYSSLLHFDCTYLHCTCSVQYLSLSIIIQIQINQTFYESEICMVPNTTWFSFMYLIKIVLGKRGKHIKKSNLSPFRLIPGLYKRHQCKKVSKDRQSRIQVNLDPIHL